MRPWRAVTLRRWNRNPFQMWMLVFLIYVSSNQVFFSTATGAVSDLARKAQLNLAICNLVGGFIVFCGLHLRDKMLSHWVELCGYIALIGSMGIYVSVVLSVSVPPTTSFGLGLSEAFVIASSHRALLIATRKFILARQMKRRGVKEPADEGERTGGPET